MRWTISIFRGWGEGAGGMLYMYTYLIPEIIWILVSPGLKFLLRWFQHGDSQKLVYSFNSSGLPSMSGLILFTHKLFSPKQHCTIFSSLEKGRLQKRHFVDFVSCFLKGSPSKLRAERSYLTILQCKRYLDSCTVITKTIGLSMFFTTN